MDESEKITPPITPQQLTEAVELMFFVYRDFISDPDKLLAEHGFGRAHHRVLHFIGRQPGLSVAELLDILAITKQSLARVLRDLLQAGYVQQTMGQHDRRKRLLTLSPKGHRLHAQLLAPQQKRFLRAIAKSERGTVEAWRNFMLQLVNPDNQANILRHIEQNHPEQNHPEQDHPMQTTYNDR